MSDTNCPYCNAEIEIDHEDGYGYEEDMIHQQECSNCEKTFAYTTSMWFSYSTNKADCLNGGEHKYKPTFTHPKEYTKMRCSECDDERNPTDKEMKQILK